MQRYVPPRWTVAPGLGGRRLERGREVRADGIRHRHVRDDALLEERGDAALRVIVELVGNDEVEGAIRSRMLPTALTEMTHSTPSAFIP